MRILEPLTLGGRTAPSRVVFGAHETNLGRRRALGERHVAYYERRAAGGAGAVVIEEASVHPSDWPYERCPLATDCGPGWAAIATAVHAHGALALAALGHAGGQGSSAYSQLPLWAPSRVPEVASREVPKSMEAADIAAVIAGFRAAALAAVAAGCDGVEVNAGQNSLVRQFLSGLTNHRDDEWGADRSLLARRVLVAAREGMAGTPGAVLALRLSCDELAPWAGLVPDAAVEVAVALAPLVDAITVVRGSIYTVSATRPDGHTRPGFNLELARRVRAAVPERVRVIAQGSIVDSREAEAALADGGCDAVEMTRAQIADPGLVARLRAGAPDRIRPCVLCNQACQVRDVRNPIVSCVGEPHSGHETTEAPPGGTAGHGVDVLVVGGGVAGLECARVAALRGYRVTLVERSGALGGAVRVAARGAGRERLGLLAGWLEAECRHLGVTLELGREVQAAEALACRGRLVLCTGALPGRQTWPVDAGARVVTASQALAEDSLPAGAVAVWDPIGGPIGISVAERLRADGHDVALLTPDLVAGGELARSGDLAPAGVRLLSAGVVIHRRTLLRAVHAGHLDLEDRFSGVARRLECALLVDAGHRLPDDTLWRATGGVLARAGDAVAPRGILEAVLEGRRAAMKLGTESPR